MTEATKAQVKAGDRFYSSWGYDQTNIDYLLVVKLSPTGKTAQCRMVGPIHLGAAGTCDITTPGCSHGDLFTMRIQGDRLRGSYPYCRGGTRLGSFYKTELGEAHYPTNPLFGH